jgi:hypothetical protein
MAMCTAQSLLLLLVIIHSPISRMLHVCLTLSFVIESLLLISFM